MSSILTFLGKGGTGKTCLAIAAAKKLASGGQRVLLIVQDGRPSLEIFLSTPINSSPTPVSPNLNVMHLQTTSLLEQSWDDVKALDEKYLRSPTLKGVYGEELSILPGMDGALALNTLREYDQSGNYDVLIYDGVGGLETLRMFGIPECLSWYARRFRQVFNDSDIGKILSPFIQPITNALFNVAWSADDLAQQPTKDAANILEQGKAALADPSRVAAYLVTTGDPAAIATAQYLWGSAQQVGLTVKGLLLNQAAMTPTITETFSPLPVTPIPSRTGEDWEILTDTLPHFERESSVPEPTRIDLSARQVYIFLPGFDKKQVKLTQSGPELTIDAGDQRRNIDLPATLRSQPVKSAKFQNGYLIISF